ncbi:zincin-like metallopeptidase domain-containing protein [Paenibacillus sp. KQZ6P-2]|uniref:Zincin-like metallopeptidase domain-containing protein n=1 Tax=Paenibacillus mangrovi TaxID=2931978 RepID=A0A9X1WJJ6_9BACL|nr:zincin-like metallopeptidase domain-containing protein [Paenibacillus mangrovi]MCJ8010163.1 zincin-like metallopeptidase domain-containing protein [Paenibacillus mangrovi]
MSMKIYDMVTERIINQLEKGIVPWRRPWKIGTAVNWKTQKSYRGINTLLLEPGEYASFKQVTEAGGKVKKGEKGHIVVFWTWLEKEDENGEMTKIPYLRYYTVFEVSKQCEGLQSKRNEQSFKHDLIEEAERICEGYKNAPLVRFSSGRAFYVPAQDYISVPPICDYEKPEEYYSTLFHEHMHSTGHSNRLNRQGITEIAAFGSETYSKEELVAEIGAAMLCSFAGIDNSTIDNSVAYIGGWLRKLRSDNKMIIQAAGQAQKGVDHILGVKFDEGG